MPVSFCFAWKLFEQLQSSDGFKFGQLKTHLFNQGKIQSTQIITLRYSHQGCDNSLCNFTPWISLFIKKHTRFFNYFENNCFLSTRCHYFMGLFKLQLIIGFPMVAYKYITNIDCFKHGLISHKWTTACNHGSQAESGSWRTYIYNTEVPSIRRMGLYQGK